MTRFLRFDVSGASALLWMLLFLSPLLNIDAMSQVDATKLLAVIFGSITVSIPLGNYVHQFSDTIFNPFARWRLFFWQRAVITYIEGELGPTSRFNDMLFQAVLVFCKAYDRTSKSTKGALSRGQEASVNFKVEIIREEISNRYSYYYARIENGVVAPIVGGLLAWLTVELFATTGYINILPTFSPLWMGVFAIAIAIPILWRIPQLFRELDDLEITLVALQRDTWPTLFRA